MELFYCDLSNDSRVTWPHLLNEINLQSEYNPYCTHADIYSVFKHIIISMLYGEEIILLDSDWSHKVIEDIKDINGLAKFNKLLNNRGVTKILSKADLLERLCQTSENWRITLFTSGTTGNPKKVTHSFSSITRLIKRSNHISDIWGFAYNPTHMAGVQVFFQALLNGNLIVRLFGLQRRIIFQSIEKFRISNISATPTFYRLLLPSDETYPTVTRLTFGGEKFDDTQINQLSCVFPNARITNIYASTEAGVLFASKGSIFSVKSDQEHLIRVLDNELLIHNSMIGITENNENEWFHTGDLIEIIKRNPLEFRFISRKNEIISIGGYKVNIIEIEECIRNISGVLDVRVFAKPNSVLGNIICCEIVLNDIELSEIDIRYYLKQHLQEYKIPRIVKFVKKVATTSTGKVNRQ